MRAVVHAGFFLVSAHVAGMSSSPPDTSVKDSNTSSFIAASIEGGDKNGSEHVGRAYLAQM
jgi:hypothetical protein